MAVLLPVVEPLIEDFKAEREIAYATPRLSLAPQISRLRDLFGKANELREWPDSSCGYRLREKVIAAEEFDLDVLKGFLSGIPAPRHSGLWASANKELAEMQSLVTATRAGALRP